MAEIFKFFNSAPGDERWHYASDFADYFGGVLSDGILHTDKQTDLGLRVSVVTGTLTTKVSVGKAIIKGYAYENTTDLTLKHDIPEPTLKRIDRIVLRLDLSNSSRYVKLFVKKGASATSPIAPTLQRDQYIHELSLAQVLVRENTTQLIETDLKDERMIENLCGLVSSIISVPTTQFQEQWDTWFESVKNEGFAPYADTGFKQNLKTTDKTTIVGAVNELKEDYVRSPGYATATGTNAYAVTLNPAPTTYKEGMGLVVKIPNASTGSTTINVNDLGVKQILKANGLAVSDLKAGAVYTLRYSGSAFILQGEGGDKKEITDTLVSQIRKDYAITYIDDIYIYAVDTSVANGGQKAYKILRDNGTVVKTITRINPNSQTGIVSYTPNGSVESARAYTSYIYDDNGTLLKQDNLYNNVMWFGYYGGYLFTTEGSTSEVFYHRYNLSGTLINTYLKTIGLSYDNVYTLKICFKPNTNLIVMSLLQIQINLAFILNDVDMTKTTSRVLQSADIGNVSKIKNIAHNAYCM